MKSFEIKGTFLENGEWKKFRKLVNAENERTAKEKALALMGSKHRTKRIHIKTEPATELKE